MSRPWLRMDLAPLVAFALYGGVLCIGAAGLVRLAVPSFTAYLSPAPDPAGIPPDG
jgi:hypothetical protein